MNFTRGVRFEGGPVFLNSGGTGPDDYLLRPIGKSKWVLVICRWGRNFGWGNERYNVNVSIAAVHKDPDALAIVDEATKASLSDRVAFSEILPVRHKGVMMEKTRKLRESGKLVTMSATEFWETYKNSPVFKS